MLLSCSDWSAASVALGKEVAGRSVTKRTSYVIDRNGRVAFVHDDMNPAEHVTEALAAVRKLQKRG